MPRSSSDSIAADRITARAVDRTFSAAGYGPTVKAIASLRPVWLALAGSRYQYCA